MRVAEEDIRLRAWHFQRSAPARSRRRRSDSSRCPRCGCRGDATRASGRGRSTAAAPPPYGRPHRVPESRFGAQEQPVGATPPAPQDRVMRNPGILSFQARSAMKARGRLRSLRHRHVSTLRKRCPKIRSRSATGPDPDTSPQASPPDAVVMSKNVTRSPPPRRAPRTIIAPHLQRRGPRISDRIRRPFTT